MSVVNPSKPKPSGKHASQGGWKRQAAYLTMVLPGVLLLLAFAYLPILNKVSGGWSIILITLAVSAIAAWLFPIEAGETNDLKEEAIL